MATERYKLYRKMGTEEFSALLACGFKTDKPTSPTICPKKCFSESLITVNRLNPYYSAISNVVAEISLSPGFRDRLFRDGHMLSKPIHSCADKTYTNYEAYENMNLYYRCHGNSIPLFNHEIDPNYIEVVNDNIITIKPLDITNYEELLLNEHLGISKMRDILTSDSITSDEYYIQLPLDLAILALKYGILPPGGLNKFIKSRVIGKDYDIVDGKNNNVFPITLAIKINSKAFKSKIKDCISVDTYDIAPDLIHNLNTYIESIR
ncbi:MAG TPA: hypothetical protein PKY25_01525 [Bacilli bacterium]|nr:hypothetical protein [Bacilli bacterium]